MSGMPPSASPAGSWICGAWMCALVACTRCPASRCASRRGAVALVGYNGSGKSTLLRVLHGLVPASAGTCITALPHQQAMLFQRPHMLRTSAQTMWPWACGCVAAAGAPPERRRWPHCSGSGWNPLHTKRPHLVWRAAAACGTGPCLGAAARCIAAGRAHVQPGPPCQARWSA